VRSTFFQLRECQSTVVLETAPASVAACDLSASPPHVGGPRFAREGRPPGSQPAFAGRSVVRGGRTFYPFGYRTALACSLILPPLSQGSLLRETFPPSLVSEAGRTTGLPRSVDVPEWIGSRLYAGGWSSASQEFGACGPGHVPFWPQRNSSWRWFFVTTLERFTGVDPSHSILVPDHLAAGSRSYGLRLGCPPCGGGDVLPGTSYPPSLESTSR
jgi:hypothetical protein